MSKNVPTIYRMTISVSNLEEAIKFYTHLFGIVGRSFRGGRCYFDCGEVILAILDSNQPPLQNTFISPFPILKLFIKEQKNYPACQPR